MEVTLSVVILAVSAVIVTSAPMLNEGPAPANSVAADQEKQWNFYRERRSQYPQYVSPCAAAAAAAASSPIPAIAPAAYQVNLSPYHPYAAPNSYYAPHYRMDFEPEQEMMSFSDMDHMMPEQMARYAGYATPSHAPASYAPVMSPMGPAYGVFPNAKAGGCSVPLLFSCAPSIVAGHVVQSAPHPGYADSYRGVEPVAHHETQSQESHDETVQEHLSPAHDTSHKMVHQ